VDDFTAISAAVSAVAALGALVFAYLTVREARAAHREQTIERQRERLEEIANIAKHLGEMSYMGGDFALGKLRLAAALNAAHIPLQACRPLLHVADGKHAASASASAARAASGEIGNAIRDLDPKPRSMNITVEN